MKNNVKKFSQFVNERTFGVSGLFVGIVDLLDCYIRENHGNDRVLAQIDISNPARDLVDGGIMFTVNPTESEIGEAQYDGTYHSELYDNGERIGEEDLDNQGRY